MENKIHRYAYLVKYKNLIAACSAGCKDLGFNVGTSHVQLRTVRTDLLTEAPRFRFRVVLHWFGQTVHVLRINL